MYAIIWVIKCRINPGFQYYQNTHPASFFTVESRIPILNSHFKIELAAIKNKFIVREVIVIEGRNKTKH